MDWKINISENAPYKLKKPTYINDVNNLVKPFMDYFCERLSLINNWSSEQAIEIFSDIIDEMPIMRANTYNNNFFIIYNRYVTITLSETPLQIYRGIKLEKILK